MKNLVLIVSVLLSSIAFSQKEKVMEKLKEYHFSEDLLTENVKDADASYAFTMKMTTINSNGTTVELSNFDPTKKVGEKWKLVSVNGEKPTKSQQKKFDKNHNSTEEVNGKLDDHSWKIVSEDDKYLVVSFRYDKSTLPKKYEFLGDCIGYAYFNKETKELDKAEFKNEGPIKVKVLNVQHLDMVIHYFKSDDGTYLIKTTNLDLEVFFLGQVVNVKEVSEYTDYKKVK